MAETRRTRTERPRRRRGRFPTPRRAAVAVRGLWEQAGEEERKRAHEAATAILAWWLGLETKSKTAERLEVTPLRLWQMGQMALSGMTASQLRRTEERIRIR